MQSDIFVNGCSWSAGCELENMNTEKYSYLLSKNAVNISHGGRSNDQIVDTTINWLNNNKCKLAIIQFTFASRIQIFKNNNWVSIQTPKHKDPETDLFYAKKMYYKYIYSKKLGDRNFWKNVCHLEMFMKNKQVPYIFWHIGKTSNDDGFYINMSENKNMLNANFLRHDRDNMLSAHPSAKGHQLIAEKLLATQH